MSKKKKKILLISIPLLIFLILNIFWFMHYKKFDFYAKNIPIQESKVIGLEKDGYSYSVHKPFYLYFGGNISVAENISGDTLIIWIHNFLDNEYGIALNIENGERYTMYVDKNGYLADSKKNLSDVKIVWEENKDRILSLANKVNEFWSID